MTTRDHETETWLQRFFDRRPQLSLLLPQYRELKWRYVDVGRSLQQSAKRGFPMFVWSTERNSNGKFLSWVWQPRGEGWDRTKTVSHSKRKLAKGRALRMRDAYLQKKGNHEHINHRNAN